MLQVCSINIINIVHLYVKLYLMILLHSEQSSTFFKKYHYISHKIARWFWWHTPLIPVFNWEVGIG